LDSKKIKQQEKDKMEYQEVKREASKHCGGDSIKDTHPAFGQISINRINGGGLEFYGAAQQNHPTWFEIKIQSSECQHNLNTNWYHVKDLITSLRITSLQFTELITNMNTGEGVPCTLEFANGKYLPYIKGSTAEIDKIKARFANKLESTKIYNDEKDAEINEILNKKTINKEDRRRLKFLMTGVHESSKSGAKFAMKCFAEAAEDIESEVKREASEFVNYVARSAGLKALKNMNAEEQGNLLNEVNDSASLRAKVERLENENKILTSNLDAVNIGNVKLGEF
jgi:hypothetical protein